MNVIEALTESIDKSFVIMENYENDDLSSFSIFQEGKILDTVKKESKKDSNKLITISNYNYVKITLRQYLLILFLPYRNL